MSAPLADELGKVLVLPLRAAPSAGMFRRFSATVGWLVRQRVG